MARLDPTVATVFVAALLAIATSVALNQVTPVAVSTPGSSSVASDMAQAADSTFQRPLWAASSTGRVEPKEGEVRLTTQGPGKIKEVIAKANDRVEAGDLLVTLDSDELFAKLAAADAEALVRLRERGEDEPAKGLAIDRRAAEDSLAAAERDLFRTRMQFDDALRQLKAGSEVADVRTAREKLKAAERKVVAERQTVERLADRTDMPLPSRLESSLTQARADVRQVENAIERTRLRAPADGSVLTVWAKAGEMAGFSGDLPLVLFGDVSSLRVRAEVEERDTPKIRVGQRVVVRADAFPDRDFEGVVTQLAQALGPPRITTRGPRRPNDVEVLEVMVSLDGKPPLLTGMRVDVFFRHDNSASAEGFSR
ncbi:MAG: efflux RND transporter periplasmic adaptor subunit [Hyphomicrobium sp.]|jgi:HlyD family secretion protein